MAADFDSMMDRRDRELGAMGYGPYAEPEDVDCCICNERVSSEDAAAFEWGDVYHVCRDCCIAIDERRVEVRP